MSEPLTVICWRWQSPVGYRSTFGPEHVYALKEMLRRHLHAPYRLVCVTDQPEQLKGIETIRLWDEFRSVPSPFGAHNPSCYVRLRVFAPGAGKLFGPRLLSIDLDTVIVNDITPLVERDEDFVIWGESPAERKLWGEAEKQYYCGAMFMLKTGTRPQVYTRFDPEKTPELAKRAKCFGSDQGVISYILGPNEATWGRKDGVFSFRKHLSPRGPEYFPEAMRVAMFHGKIDPWHHRASLFPWVRRHYPLYDPKWKAA